MSEDERELDLPSDDDDYSCSSQNNSSVVTSSERISVFPHLIPTRNSSNHISSIKRTNSTSSARRDHHNALERSRRKHIKDSFSILRDSIPDIKGEKMSRARILDASTDYIQRKKNSIKNLESTLSRINQANESLGSILKRLKETNDQTQIIPLVSQIDETINNALMHINGNMEGFDSNNMETIDNVTLNIPIRPHIPTDGTVSEIDDYTIVHENNNSTPHVPDCPTILPSDFVPSMTDPSRSYFTRNPK